ncbi:type I toxin-antitoxin system Fst family toxin [Enterococcus gallinarum]|nr:MULTISPECIES: type I toxin-antitoxin system Fst family toxin [Enterococcus]HBI1562907.1 type I toxin-antitoxin system Fst family toxin [Enterococcus faecalis]EMF0076337.1 type I toxin-antitoxin system Fst family toxin [Enterococcus hirae]EMF0091724.1 type I toxin-antitoxin system Fst family toxin [Enterococcus hirae]EMF0094559.1 type I toxin-antitoxin system Fst family toxin [Enterococcus hirae]EMF0100000.1 type I toxin-antitoxin system Fst family toxin [Enterococcus hirae]
MLQQILTLVVAPILVGIVIELFAYWLDKRDDN